MSPLYTTHDAPIKLLKAGGNYVNIIKLVHINRASTL